MAATYIFCSECGSKNDFLNGRKPNFCSSCGNNLQSLAAFGAGSSRASAKQSSSDSVMDVDISVGDEEGREDVGFSMDDVSIDNGHVKVVAGNVGGNTRIIDTSRPTVGSLFANPIPPAEGEGRHGRGFKVDKYDSKATFESFQKEAGRGGARQAVDVE